jgi:hypothetical protein
MTLKCVAVIKGGGMTLSLYIFKVCFIIENDKYYKWLETEGYLHKSLSLQNM